MVKLLHTTEKIKHRNKAFAVKMDRMFDRVCLDRNLLIKEKIKCILGDDSATEQLDDALEQEQTKRLTHKIDAFKSQRTRQN